MIVITTPTGQVRRQVLDKVLDGDAPVRVISRDPSRLDARTRERVEVVGGSHDDAVFWLVPPDFQAGSVEGHYPGFTRPACGAIKKRGVGRVVGVTSLGRGYGEDAGLLPAAFAMDGLIEDTGAAYRALQMPFLWRTC